MEAGLVLLGPAGHEGAVARITRVGDGSRFSTAGAKSSRTSPWARCPPADGLGDLEARPAPKDSASSPLGAVRRRWMIVARVSCWVVSVWGLPVLYQERGCVSIRIVYKTAVVAAMKTCCRTHARACLEIIGCAYPNHLCGRTLPALPTPRQRHGQLMETKSFA